MSKNKVDSVFAYRVFNYVNFIIQPLLQAAKAEAQKNQEGAEVKREIYENPEEGTLVYIFRRTDTREKVLAVKYNPDNHPILYI